MNELIEKALKNKSSISYQEWKEIYYFALENEIDDSIGDDFETNAYLSIIFQYNNKIYRLDVAINCDGWKDFYNCFLYQVKRQKVEIETWSAV